MGIKARLIIACVMALSTSAHAQVPGLWFGDESKDPISDKTNALAMIYDDAETGISAALRCRDGKIDFFVGTGTPNFTKGETSKALLRIDAEQPKEFPAIATEPTLLALDIRSSKDVVTNILHAKKFALRVSGTYSRSLTMTFTPALRPNTLHLVGRVAAACDIAPYPTDEINAATRETLDESAPKRKRRR